MINLTKQEIKTIEKFKRRVQKQYPGAFHREIKKGYYTIMQEKDDLSIVDVLAESLMPPSNNVIQAWENAALSVKINQNIMRTHPLKLDALDLSDKALRKSLNRNR
jgi:hypothetical protein